jgi:predicted Rossmann-fold nucleotide-binding protein
MEAVSRGAKDAGGQTYGVTAEFFARMANSWVDKEVRLKTWQDRLFELIRLGDGFVACKGGTGTLAELAVAWEMLNKSVMTRKPFAILGPFWEPIIERVRQVELAHEAPWSERNGQLVYLARTPEEAARHLKERLR